MLGDVDAICYVREYFKLIIRFLLTDERSRTITLRIMKTTARRATGESHDFIAPIRVNCNCL